MKVLSLHLNNLDSNLGGVSTINKLKGSAYDSILHKLEGKYEFMRMGKNEAFGELALINDTPRGATVICTKDCHFAVLSKDNCKYPPTHSYSQ